MKGLSSQGLNCCFSFFDSGFKRGCRSCVFVPRLSASGFGPARDCVAACPSKTQSTDVGAQVSGEPNERSFLWVLLSFVRP